MSKSANRKINKPITYPETFNLSTQERIEFIARLIAERIAEDKANDYPLLKKLQKQL